MLIPVFCVKYCHFYDIDINDRRGKKERAKGIVQTMSPLFLQQIFPVFP